MALTCIIRVVPSSGRQICVPDKNGGLKCFLKSEAEKGKANEELCSLIAHALKIPVRNVSLLSGFKHRSKIVKIEGDYTLDQLLVALSIQKQTRLDHKL